MLKKILIANRGEIACRVINTARRLGVKTVAVYSDFDHRARHVELADEAVHIGESAANASYLNIDAVVEAAQKTGAEGIHPGYGFLSENAEFAQACSTAGIVFIGPPANAIEVMGSKQASKQLMEGAAVPLIPGYHNSDDSDDVLTEAASTIGFPLMIKASAGGGGKGMRRVDRAEDFDSHLAAARREAKAAFGDDRILLEKMLIKARHVEIQVFADDHGNVVHLFERDCSLQRRHQKVIEEAPAPHLSEQTRQAMGQAAVAAARAVDYRGAGTVEFIMDADQSFYFMEMNTRLQVEHPVTEMITGVDLVEWQLRVASGEPLPMTQDELHRTGWSVEARLYAENPAKRFLPATGQLHHLVFPDADANLRIETGVRQCDTIGIYYDPMIAKIVASGADRPQAIARLERALADTQICGLTTNLAFLKRLLADPEFVAGQAHTQYLDAELDQILAQMPTVTPELVALAALTEYINQANQYNTDDSVWAGGWRSMTNERARFALAFDKERFVAELEQQPRNSSGGTTQPPTHSPTQREQFTVAINGAAPIALDLLNKDLRTDPSVSGTLEVMLNSTLTTLGFARIPGNRGALFVDGKTYPFVVEPDYTKASDAAAAGGAMSAPMPGNVVAVLVAVGDSVRAGDPLVVIEAMKMEHKIVASKNGRVAALPFSAGDAVEENTVLVELA